MAPNEAPEEDFVVVDLEALWNRNYHALRDCRSIQRRVQDLGIRIPIQHLLVLKRHLSPTLAWEGVEDPPAAPKDMPFTHREDKVITAAIARNVLTTGQMVAAQQILDALVKIGIQATLSYVLVELNYLRWKDLKEIDQTLDQGNIAEETAVPDLDNRPADDKTMIPSLDDRAPSAEVTFPERRAERPEEDQDKLAQKMRKKMRHIPDDEMADLLRETRMLRDSEIDSAILGRRDMARSTDRSILLGEFLLDTKVITPAQAKVLVKTWVKTRFADDEGEA